jgi:hypothetical protein
MNITDELSKLEHMKQSNFLNELEFSQAKTALLANDKHLESLRIKTALNQLDMEWQYAQENYKVTGRYGVRFIPTKLSAIIYGLLPTIGGILLVYVGLSPTSNLDPNSPMRSFAPVAGIALSLFSLWNARTHYLTAQAYEKARAAYNSERARIRYQRR